MFQTREQTSGRWARRGQSTEREDWMGQWGPEHRGRASCATPDGVGRPDAVVPQQGRGSSWAKKGSLANPTDGSWDAEIRAGRRAGKGDSSSVHF